VAALHAAIRAVLEAGITAQGSSLGGSSQQNYLRPGGSPGGFQEAHHVFRRTGQPCDACGAPIARIIIAQRSTHFCPACQV
jgi:formamidopyrimidine-DNA glycosylase